MAQITVVELSFRDGREHIVSTRALYARHSALRDFLIMKGTCWLLLVVSFLLKAS